MAYGIRYIQVSQSCVLLELLLNLNYYLHDNMNVLYLTIFFFLLLQVSNQEAVDIARSLCISVEKPEPLLACKKLADLAVSRGSSDDVSVMLIQMGGYASSSDLYRIGHRANL